MPPEDISPELAHLLERLAFARTNGERLQLLFQSWRKVKSLSAEDRDRLVMHLGVEGADDLVNHLVMHKTGKKAPPELSAAIRALEKEDPRKVKRLLESLKNPSTFQNQQVIADALQRVGSTAADAALQAHDPPSYTPPYDEQPTSYELQPALPETAPHAAPPAPAPPAPRPPASALPSAHLPAASPAHLPAASPAPAHPPAPAAAPTAASRSAENAAASTARAAAAATESDAAWSKLRDQTSDASPEPSPRHDRSLGAELVAKVRSVRATIHRFRMLHDARGQLALLDDDGCDLLLEEFPLGWARKRALALLLEAGAFDDPKRAEQAIGKLASPSARLALSGLLHRR